MKKIFIVALSIFVIFISAGCGGTANSEEPAETPPPEKVEEENVPHSDKFVTADKDFSNLQIPEFNKPVYDPYGVWTRREKNYATTLPESLHPYESQEKIVYLTFDDGPDPINTPAALDILRNEQVPGTFYVLGYMAEQNPEILKRIFNEGHAIGNHSYDHDYKNLYASPWAFMEQIIKTDNVIQSIVGVRPLIIRAPGGTVGAFDENYWEMLRAFGYVEHDWNIVTQDATPERPDAQMQVNNVINQMGDSRPNTVIVLMHTTYGKEETIKALPEIIHLFKDWGYKFGVVTPMTPNKFY